MASARSHTQKSPSVLRNVIVTEEYVPAIITLFGHKFMAIMLMLKIGLMLLSRHSDLMSSFVS